MGYETTFHLTVLTPPALTAAVPGTDYEPNLVRAAFEKASEAADGKQSWSPLSYWNPETGYVGQMKWYDWRRDLTNASVDFSSHVLKLWGVGEEPTRPDGFWVAYAYRGRCIVFIRGEWDHPLPTAAEIGPLEPPPPSPTALATARARALLDLLTTARHIHPCPSEGGIVQPNPKHPTNLQCTCIVADLLKEAQP